LDILTGPASSVSGHFGFGDRTNPKEPTSEHESQEEEDDDEAEEIDLLNAPVQSQEEEDDEEVEETVADDGKEVDKEATDSEADKFEDLLEEDALLEEIKTLSENTAHPVEKNGTFNGYVVTPKMIGEGLRIMFGLKAFKAYNAILIMLDNDQKNQFIRIIQRLMLPGGQLQGPYAMKNMMSQDLAIKQAVKLANEFGDGVVYSEKTIAVISASVMERIVKTIISASCSASVPRNTATKAATKTAEEIDLVVESESDQESEEVEVVEALKQQYREAKKQENSRAPEISQDDFKQRPQTECKLCLSNSDLRSYQDRLYPNDVLELRRLQNWLVQLDPPCKVKVRFLQRWGSKLILSFKNQATKTMFGDYFKMVIEKKLNVAAVNNISTLGKPYLEQYVKTEERRDNQQTQRRRNANANKTPRFDLSSLDDN